MKVKALTSFAGKISMFEGEVREIADDAIAKDLINARYIEAIEEKPAPKEEPKKVVAKKATKKR